MTQPDPWGDIGLPPVGFRARRADATHPANLFWARDHRGRCALLLQYDPDVVNADPRPALHGVEIAELPEHEGKRAFLLVLRNAEDREIFEHLCHDIIESTRHCQGDAAVLTALLRRTWKWHRLLRGGADRRLGPQEQQGLIGELLVLERLLQAHAPSAALASWRGPLDEPKDFVLGSRALEVKARHISKNSVRISSEAQLQLIEEQSLHLVVVSVTPADPATSGSLNLDQLVERISATLSFDQAAEATFEARLASAGWLPEDDYSGTFWVHGEMSAFSVGDGFPRIEASSLPPGISNVRYQLELDACAPFKEPVAPLFQPDGTND